MTNAKIGYTKRKAKPIEIFPTKLEFKKYRQGRTIAVQRVALNNLVKGICQVDISPVKDTITSIEPMHIQVTERAETWINLLNLGGLFFLNSSLSIYCLNSIWDFEDNRIPEVS